MYKATIGQLVMIRDGFRMWFVIADMKPSRSTMRYSNDEMPCIIIKEQNPYSVYCSVLCGADIFLIDTEALLPL